MRDVVGQLATGWKCQVCGGPIANPPDAVCGDCGNGISAGQTATNTTILIPESGKVYG